MINDAINLWTLFISAFVSATLLPGGSEIILATLNHNAQYSVAVLLLVATAGNTLGGMTSYGLGRLIAWRYPNQLLSDARNKAVRRIKKWGTVSLLFSWLPIIGDPLCVAAGYLRIHPLLACMLFAVGKLLRYVFIIWISHSTPDM